MNLMVEFINSVIKYKSLNVDLKYVISFIIKVHYI